MKKLIGLVSLILLLFVGPVLAAETMVIASGGKQDIITSGSRLRKLTLDCTTDTDGSFSVQLTEDMYAFMRGWFITEVRVINATTQTDPTANSDLYLRLTAVGFDLLHGAGVDQVDNDTTNSFPPLDSLSAPSVIYVVDQFFVEVENNAVNTALFTLTFILFPSR